MPTLILEAGDRPAGSWPHYYDSLESFSPAGYVFVGLEYQRSYASNTLRGVSEDARAVVAPLVAWIRDAPTTVGLAP